MYIRDFADSRAECKGQRSQSLNHCFAMAASPLQAQSLQMENMFKSRTNQRG